MCFIYIVNKFLVICYLEICVLFLKKRFMLLDGNINKRFKYSYFIRLNIFIVVCEGNKFIL